MVEFGNSPLVQRHLKVLKGGEKATVAPVRLQVNLRVGAEGVRVGWRGVTKKILADNFNSLYTPWTVYMAVYGPCDQHLFAQLLLGHFC